MVGSHRWKVPLHREQLCLYGFNPPDRAEWGQSDLERFHQCRKRCPGTHERPLHRLGWHSSFEPYRHVAGHDGCGGLGIGRVRSALKTLAVRLFLKFEPKSPFFSVFGPRQERRSYCFNTPALLMMLQSSVFFLSLRSYSLASILFHGAGGMISFLCSHAVCLVRHSRSIHGLHFSYPLGRKLQFMFTIIVYCFISSP